MPLRRIVSTFWPYAAPRRWWMLGGLVLAGLDPLLMAAEIWLFKIVVDDVLIPGDFSLFPAVAGLYLALTLVQSVLGGADRMISTWLTQRFLVDTRTALLRPLSSGDD